MQKKAQYALMNQKSTSLEHKTVLLAASWDKLLRSRTFWLGLVIYIAHGPFILMALVYAPETTVKPIGCFEVVMNFLLSYGIIHERFTRQDLTASVCCILGTLTMNMVTPANLPGYIRDFPVEELVDFSHDLLVQPGLWGYLIAWFALLGMAVYLLATVQIPAAKPFAWPLLIGLLASQFHFVSKLETTLLWNSWNDPDVWNSSTVYMSIGVSAFLWTTQMLAKCEGLRQLACRFFVPATFVFSEMLSIVQITLFFGEWDHMDSVHKSIFTLACIFTLISVFYISPVHKVILPPNSEGPRSPLLKPTDDELNWHEPILAIMDEYKVRRPMAEHPASWEDMDTIEMSSERVPYTAKYRWFPLAFTILMFLIPIVMIFMGWFMAAFTFLTLFTIYQAWKMGAFIALYALVGIKKMAHYETADFKALHLEEERRNRRRTDIKAPPYRFDEVMHFVIMPNYKEDVGIMRQAIGTIAESGIARSNICLVLAMEERETDSDKKAQKLCGEFEKRFYKCFATYHPPGIEGETPGKSSNTRWSARRVIDELIPKNGMRVEAAILTVADADSQFHCEYFAAATYHFLHAGGDEGRVPDRYLTIWQPPILHYKNYVTQPAIVRLASMITSEHELANLADPNATRVPYSTYSLSAVLAKAVDGWDPDFISEDWHMALKCFFATNGRCRVIPIFLAVINYAPEENSCLGTIKARWVQAKRHALGFSEIVYFLDHFCRVFGAIPSTWSRCVYLWRAFFLFTKLLMIHITMALFFILGPLNGYLISYFATNTFQSDISLDINSWTFLVNCVFQGISLIAFVFVFIMSQRIYEAVERRIDGADNPNLSIWWRSRLLHVTAVTLQSITFVLPLFIAASLAEWIAACKTAVTHKFDYVVAAKPVLDGDQGNGGSTSSTKERRA